MSGTLLRLLYRASPISLARNPDLRYIFGPKGEGHHWIWFPMLRKLSNEVRSCYEHADECARKADAAMSATLRADFLRLQENWLKLACSYELAERLLDVREREQPPSSRILRRLLEAVAAATRHGSICRRRRPQPLQSPGALEPPRAPDVLIRANGILRARIVLFVCERT